MRRADLFWAPSWRKRYQDLNLLMHQYYYVPFITIAKLIFCWAFICYRRGTDKLIVEAAITKLIFFMPKKQESIITLLDCYYFTDLHQKSVYCLLGSLELLVGKVWWNKESRLSAFFHKLSAHPGITWLRGNSIGWPRNYQKPDR